jgi:hypothetical protein
MEICRETNGRQAELAYSGIRRHTQEGNTKTNFEYLLLAQGTVQWRTSAHTVINFWVPKRREIRGSTGRKTLLPEINWLTVQTE